MGAVQNWVGALVDPDHVANAMSGLDSDISSAKRTRIDQIPTSPPIPYGGYVNIPPPPMNAPPPLPSNPIPSTQAQAAFLPLFNQTANQRRLTVEYPAQFTGPPHAGVWSVSCIGKLSITTGQHKLTYCV